MLEKRQNDKGVAPVLGFILLMGMMIAFVSFYLGFIAPQHAMLQEGHTQKDVLDDMHTIGTNIDVATERERVVSQRIRTGATYSALSTINPAVFSVTYKTTEKQTKQFTISRYSSTDSDFITGESAEPIQFETKSLELDPTGTNPNLGVTGIEYGIPYTNDRQGNGVMGTQTMVRDNIITIPIIDSVTQTQTNGDAFAVISATPYNETTVSISGIMELTFETEQSHQAWNQTLEEEHTDNGGNINKISYEENSNSLNTVTIRLKKDVDYKFYMTKVNIEVR